MKAAPSAFRDRILPVLTVILAILVIWHVFVVYLNAPFVRDQAARAGETITFS
ncbi:MAG: ABC transporter permease, partial [Allorhizobium sp.]